MTPDTSDRGKPGPSDARSVDSQALAGYPVTPPPLPGPVSFDQRWVELAQINVTTPAGGPPERRTVTVTMPQDEYWAPPGYYMLDVKDQEHRPSMAAWIRLKRTGAG